MTQFKHINPVYRTKVSRMIKYGGKYGGKGYIKKITH